MTFTRFRHAGFMRPVAVALVSLLVLPTIVGASDVIPPVPPPPRPAIVGFVDTHLHQFANLGFGGLEVWGSPMDPTLDAVLRPTTSPARARCRTATSSTCRCRRRPIISASGGAPAGRARRIAAVSGRLRRVRADHRPRSGRQQRPAERADTAWVGRPRRDGLSRHERLARVRRAHRAAGLLGVAEARARQRLEADGHAGGEQRRSSASSRFTARRMAAATTAR